MRSSVSPYPRERPRISLAPVTPPAAGVDIIASLTALHVALRNDHSIYVATSRTQATSWTLALVATDGADDAIPTLAVDRWDNLYCWYHDASAVAHAYISKDAGATWSAWTTISTFEYPRPLVTLTRALVVGYSGAGLTLRSSDDLYAMTSTLASFGGVSRQLAALGIDRHGWHHLVYASGSDIAHTLTQDPANWPAATTLIAGKSLPSAAYGSHLPAALVGGVVAFWDGSTLQDERTESDYASLAGGLVAPGLGVSRQVVGVCFDRADRGWLVGQVSGSSFAIRWSPDYGASWRSP